MLASVVKVTRVPQEISLQGNIVEDPGRPLLHSLERLIFVNLIAVAQILER